MTQFGLPNAADIALKRTLIRQVLIQLILCLGAAVILYFTKGNVTLVVAAIYGGAVSIVGSLVSAWQLRVATNTEQQQQGAVSLAGFYKASLYRLLVIIVLLAIGFAQLKLAPLGILVGFIAAQIGYFFGRPLRAR